MNALVTGASGFIGARMVRHLLAHGHEVHVLARGEVKRLRDVSKQFTVHTGDLCHPDSLQQIVHTIQPTHIFHFANQGVYPGETIPEEQFQKVNTDGLRNLLTALRATAYEGFINIGSSSEYGRKHEPMRERDVCEPVSPYGVSKLYATQAATEEAHTYDKPVATFRIFSPYGPEDDPRRLIPTAIRSLRSETPFTRPHKDAVRDYIYVDDICDLLYEASSRLALHKGEIFNVGRGEELHAHEVVSEIARTLQKEAYLNTLPEGTIRAPTESPRWVADMSKTFAAFETRPTTSLADGLAATMAYE